jgi:hypothetical protein
VIVDTAYFVDSEQAPLIQIADFLAYMIQRKAALDEGAPPRSTTRPVSSMASSSSSGRCFSNARIDCRDSQQPQPLPRHARPRLLAFD